MNKTLAAAGLSALTLAGTAEKSTLEPTLPYVDNGMEYHLALALQVLESRLKGQWTPQRLFTFCPELHVPESL